MAASTAPEDIRNNYHRAGAALLLAAVVLATFGVALWGDFVWDDRPLIVDNRRVQEFSEIPALLTSSFWETADRHDRFRLFFRPVVGLSYAIDFAAWGPNPLGFHATNLLLHWICCLLVFAIARSEGVGAGCSLAGAALMAVHPVHVESVAWISGRTDLMATAFVLGAFLAYRHWKAGSGTPWLWASTVLLLAAVLSKEVAVTLPLLVALDRWFDGDRASGRLRSAMSVALPYLAVVTAYLVVRQAVLDSGAEPLFTLTVFAWLATAVFSLARYATLMLLPVGLDAHYPYPPLISLVSPLVLMSLPMLGVLTAVVYRLRQSSSRVAFWVSWIFVCLTPVLAFGHFGDVILADRFAYLPSVGLSVLLAVGLSRLLGDSPWTSPRQRPAVVTATLVLLSVLAVSSHVRCRVWRNDLALFSDMVRTSPASSLVRANLGLAHYRLGQLPEAVAELEAAVALSPGFVMAHNNLAAALETKGDLTGALRHYLEALRVAPGQVDAAINVGHLLTRLGQTERGLTTLRRIVHDNPEHGHARYALAEALERSGESAVAALHLEAALSADPLYANPYYLLGKIRLDQGRTDEAVAAMRSFLHLWPAEDRYAKRAREVIRDHGPAS